MSFWKKDSIGYHADLGNNLYLVVEPTKVWVKGKEVRKWRTRVVLSLTYRETVRQWSGGGDGHGNYRTVKEAKKGGMFEAECVGKAVLDSLKREDDG